MHVSLKSACQIVLTLSLTIAMLGLVGCEDEAARERENLQATVAQANDTLRQATLLVVRPDNKEQFERIRTDLNKVVNSLRSVASGDTGQETSVNLLLADAGQKLAALDLAEVDQTAAEIRENQTLARTQIRSLLRLSAFVEAAESIDISQESSALDNARTGANEQLRAASEMLAQLDEPISRLGAENSEDAAKIAALRREAEQLLRRATAQGPADGFPQYEQAVAKNRQAGEFETKIARREVDLAYQYEPEHQSAGSQAQHLQQFIDSLEKAKQNLITIAQSINAEASKTNTRIADYRKSIDQRLSDIQAALSGPLEEAYRNGLDAADKALSAAKAAGRQRTAGDKGTTPKLLEAQVLETQGRLHWARARALADHVSLLDSVIAAGAAVGNSSQYQQLRGKSQQALDESLGLARDAYTAAQAALPTGGNNELNALNRSLEMAISAIGGKNTSDMSFTTPAAGMGANGSGSETGGGTGYQSPEQLMAALQTIDPMRPETSLILINAVQSTSPLQSRLIDSVRTLNDASVKLAQAVISNLGREAADAIAKMGAAQTPDYSTAKISQQSAESATIEMEMLELGSSTTIELVNVDGSWMVSFDSLIAQLEMPGMPVSDVASLLNTIAEKMIEAATKVENGEITDMQQLMQTMQAG